VHFVHNRYMTKINVLSTTKARNILPDLIESIKQSGKAFVLGRRNIPEAILIKFPSEYSVNASDITNINMYSSSFDFLSDEPDIYKISSKK
jgi:hypothetical protein